MSTYVYVYGMSMVVGKCFPKLHEKSLNQYAIESCDFRRKRVGAFL